MYDLKKYKKVFIFGSGKASFPMAKALLGILEDEINGGLIVTKGKEGTLGPIQAIKGSHPIPDHDSLDAGEGLLSYFKELKKDDFYIFLLSGGSSAMIECLKQGISLEDLQKTNKILLSNPISINIINKVRKKISLVKNGGLSSATKAKGIVLVLSDVIGDDLHTIGSAPFLSDEKPFCIDEIPNYILEKLPKSVLKHLKKKDEKINIDTPKHYIIASNFLALKAAKKEAKRLGYKASIITDTLNGLAVDVAHNIIHKIKKTKNKTPICRLYGGETTVDVKGKGLGGRNQHMSLYALSLLKDNKEIAFLSAGTDGIDGNSKGAGACVDACTYNYAKKNNIDIMNYLKRFDSYSFFKKTGDLIITGPTGTNVMDITIALKKSHK